MRTANSSNPSVDATGRVNFSKIPPAMELPNLITVQKESFERFMGQGLAEAFAESSPIENNAGTMELTFGNHEFGDPQHTIAECRAKDITYQAPLLVEVRFTNKETGEIKEQLVFMGDFPLMTDRGTFIINGTERVVVSQLVRSPGVYFSQELDSNVEVQKVQFIPARGAWLEFEVDKRGKLVVSIDRKRRQSATLLLRALGIAESDDEIVALLGDSDVVKDTLLSDTARTRDEALIEIYKRQRPGEPPTVDAARSLVDGLYLNPQRYDLAKVGRYKIDKKLGIDVPADVTVLTPEDIVAALQYLLALHEGDSSKKVDDIDHFGNRRVRTVGELVANQFRIGMSRMERVIRERMASQDPDDITPQSLINIRPIVAAIKEFFGSSQLSQFMDQANPLSGLTHKRRLSALGPGGLAGHKSGSSRRTNVPTAVRDVHNSHYARMCPLETPEGPNIGLIGTLALYAHVNDYGFIETPYRRVVDGEVTDIIDWMTADEEEDHVIAPAFRIGMSRMERVIRERMASQDPDDITPQSLINIRPIVAAIKEFFGSSQLSQFMDQANPLSGLTHKRRLSALGPGGLAGHKSGSSRRTNVPTAVRDVHNSHYARMCPLETPEGPNIGLIGTLALYAHVNDYGFIETPYRRVVDGEVTDIIDWMTADEEEDHVIAPADQPVDQKTGRFVDIDPQTGAVTEAERIIARTRDYDGTFGAPAECPVSEVDYMDVSPRQLLSVAATLIPFLEHDDAKRTLMGANMQRQAVPLIRPTAPLVGTGMEYRAALDSGELITADFDGTVVEADACHVTVDAGENGLQRYDLPKYERSNQSSCINHRPIVHAGDEVVAGQPLADSTSVEHSELALGANLTVAYMPWEGFNYEDGIVDSELVVQEDLHTTNNITRHEIDARDKSIGAEVVPGDILVGKVTTKVVTALTAEERLLRAIFCAKAHDVRYTSLKMTHGAYGRVVDLVRFSLEAGDDLPPGVNEMVHGAPPGRARAARRGAPAPRALRRAGPRRARHLPPAAARRRGPRRRRGARPPRGRRRPAARSLRDVARLRGPAPQDPGGRQGRRLPGAAGGGH